MKYFYHKYTVYESFTEDLHSLDLSDDERQHLFALVDSSLYHVVLDEILSNLTSVDKKAFLHRLKENPEDEKLMDFLNNKIDGIEDKIKKVANDLVLEMQKDLKEAKKLKK